MNAQHKSGLTLTIIVANADRMPWQGGVIKGSMLHAIKFAEDLQRLMVLDNSLTRLASKIHAPCAGRAHMTLPCLSISSRGTKGHRAKDELVSRWSWCLGPMLGLVLCDCWRPSFDVRHVQQCQAAVLRMAVSRSARKG